MNDIRMDTFSRHEAIDERPRAARRRAALGTARRATRSCSDAGDARSREADAHYLAPAEPTKILAVHLTYASRVDEYAAKRPPAPSYFMKPPTTLNGHRGEVRRPAGTRFLNYEGELAVVSASGCTASAIDDALDHVAGYTCANDVGLHDFRHADRGSMLRVKGQDGFLPLGPELVPAASSTRPTSRCART